MTHYKLKIKIKIFKIFKLCNLLLPVLIITTYYHQQKANIYIVESSFDCLFLQNLTINLDLES